MATKLDRYVQMAGQTANEITKNRGNWTAFLGTASKLYRYQFTDQLLIHAQRPQATACAEFDLWNKRMRRYIRRGSKGIGLVRMNNGRPSLRYVFDVADTEKRRDARGFVLWHYKNEYSEAITKHLEEYFGVKNQHGISELFGLVTVKCAKGFWKKYGDNVISSTAGSCLENLDERSIRVKFCNLLAYSVCYMVLIRCGTDSDKILSQEVFDGILDFNTSNMTKILGYAVSQIGELILHQIAIAVFEYEREQAETQHNRRTAEKHIQTQNRQRTSDTDREPEQAHEPPVAGDVRNDNSTLTDVPQPATEDTYSEDNTTPDNTADAESLQDSTPTDVPQPATEDTEGNPTPDVPEAASVETSTEYDLPETDAQSDAQLPIVASEPEIQKQPAAENFVITDDRLGEGGPKAKFKQNIAAIAVLKQIEGENRAATPDEQEILSCYVGWGGIPDAFDKEKSGWAAEYTELETALTPEEYTSARSSTLNAHYTCPVVIKAIYEAIGGMGFKSGNILEPSCGVGNFFGLLPEKMKSSKLYGVELDSVSGRIAKQLYPDAKISVCGYEKTDFPNNFFDIAVGNVPFGNYKVNDPAYNRLGFSIHNYFLAKALDQVRPDGIVAFVTSRYTMDAKDTDVRKYLAERSNLLGAIRLPNNAFKSNAGTEVVSDILFLQKRDTPCIEMPAWVQTAENSDGFAVNQYFMDHPDMVLGSQTSESTAHGMDYTVLPIPDADLAAQLREAVSQIKGCYHAAALAEQKDNAPADTIPADLDVKNYSFTLVDNEIYYRENSVMTKQELNQTAENRIKGMIALRDCVHELIHLQMDESVTDSAISQKQAELNQLYNIFIRKYGLINDRANRLAFDRDSSYYLLCSLEILDDDGKLQRKADMFTKRTIKQHKTITSVDTASEALAVSIGEHAKVDLPFMGQLTGKDESELIRELSGIIYKDPVANTWQTADEYLSGNVRRKLRQAKKAAEQNPDYQVNVEALTAAQPKDLDAAEIEVRLGATWIDKSYIQQFMIEILKTPYHLRHIITVNYSPATAEWFITSKSRIPNNDVAAYTTYGTNRANAYKILEDSLNLRDVRIYDTVEDAEGKEKRVLNAKETTLAQQKQQALRDAFRDWIFKDPERRQALVHQYNEEMNSTRPREYDGSHITFPGINPSIQLQPHQINAIARVLYGGNTLLAHEVGAGKSFEMIAAAMESKRLGLCHKAICVVPNHLTEQMAAEWLRLYHSANLLVTTKRDFETANRKKFCARIATSDIDAVIIGHSQFECIPISSERQERLIQSQIDEITAGIQEVRDSGGERFTVKQLERTKKGLEERLEKLQANHRKDSVVTFEELGVDLMLVDESDNYKNLFLYTKMRNVAGLSTTDAQKSSDMFAKCQYMDEITGGRGIVFATGTPISNSMTEMYTIQKYLQHDRLQELNMLHFDCWASRFGETVISLELAPEGTGYRARTRFAKFFNLPELMNLFKEIADIKTADQLHLPTPEAEYHNIVTEPTAHQQAMVKELSKRAEKVHNGIDPHIDNMLRITSDGRKLGLDQRILNPLLPDDPDSKVNTCVDNVYRIWTEYSDTKATQLIFCDISTPKSDGSFNVYDDIRQKLVQRGIPEEQVRFIHEANSDVQKKELFAKVRSGQVRVLIGSTQKMGAGTNVQDRLIALHDLDAPWRPRDLIQRSGRIIRRGNQNAKVHIFRYVTNGTFDSYLWQTLENKQKFISQVMTSKSPVRSCEDVDESVLSFAEVKALCAGDPRIKERMDLDLDVSRLKILKANYNSNQYQMEDNLLKNFPSQIQEAQSFITGIQSDIQTLQQHPHPTDGFAGMEIQGMTYTDKAEAGTALLDTCREINDTEPVNIGSYRGFALSVKFSGYVHKLALKGAVSYQVELGADARGNITRIDNSLDKMPESLENYKTKLSNLLQQQEAAKKEVGKPFPQEEELRQKSARLAELDAELNIGAKQQETT